MQLPRPLALTSAFLRLAVPLALGSEAACQPQELGATGMLLDLPDWAVGDWVCLAESDWPGQWISGATEDTPWSEPDLETLRVVGLGTFLDVECWLLELRRPGAAAVGGSVVAYLDRDTGARRRVQRTVPTRPPTVTDSIYPPGPAWPNGDSFCFPVFPLVEGEARSFTERSVHRPDGSLIRSGDEGFAYGHAALVDLAQSVAADPSRPNCLRVTVSATEGKSVMRWVPEKPWWVQAWYLYDRKGWYRWALAGTSWDTPPLDELEGKLPGTVGDWRRADPEVIRIPEEGKGLTSYTKTAQVAYTKDDSDLLVWFVPLRYDTVFEEAEEDSPPRTRTIHQAENYRVILWAPDDPAEADPQFVKALREALAAYPKATLDEYPLPRAAPGGKILEDEPADQ